MLIAHCRCPSREPCCTSTLLLVTMSLFSGVPWDPSHPLCPPTHALGPLWWVPSQGLSLGTPRSVGNRDLFPALCSAGHHGLTAVGLSGAPQGSWSPGIPGPALEGGTAESLQQSSLLQAGPQPGRVPRWAGLEQDSHLLHHGQVRQRQVFIYRQVPWGATHC